MNSQAIDPWAVDPWLIAVLTIAMMVVALVIWLRLQYGCSRVGKRVAPTLHLHAWGSDPDADPLIDIDVPLIDEYDEYWQYGARAPGGRWLELRIMK